jgi:hypothetical protein
MQRRFERQGHSHGLIEAHEETRVSEPALEAGAAVPLVRSLISAGLLAEMGERYLCRCARDLHQPFERVGDVLDQENGA